MKEVLQNDERNGKFEFQYEYNSETNLKMKRALGKTEFYKRLHVLYNLVAYTIIILVMVYFELETYDEVDTVTQDVLVSAIAQDFIDPMTVGYGFIIEILAWINEYITVKLIENKNFRYKAEYNDDLAT